MKKEIGMKKEMKMKKGEMLSKMLRLVAEQNDGQFDKGGSE